MHRRRSLFFTGVRIVSMGVLGALLVLLHYILKTPQPLKSTLPGKSHLFKWTHGHVFYTVLGSPDAPPLVLLHTPAIGGSSYEFLALAEGLAPHYCVYALDLLGFGLSDHPGINYTSETYTTLCSDFLTQVVQRSAIVVASGWSCNYALAVTRSVPQLCERLVLLSPRSFFHHKQESGTTLHLLQQPLVGLLVYAFLVMPGIVRIVLAWQKHVSDVAKSELRYTYASSHQLGAQHAVVALLTGQLQLDVWDVSETLSTPTLIMIGANITSVDESIINLDATNDAVQEVQVQGAAFWPHQEQPAEVVLQLLHWHMPNTFGTDDNGSSVDTATSGALAEASLAEAQTREIPGTALETTGYTEEDEDNTSGEHVEAYCVKCKEKRIMQDPTNVVTKNGRNAKTGTCPVCSTTLFRFITTEKE